MTVLAAPARPPVGARARGVRALVGIADAARLTGTFERRRWHVIGSERHPVAAQLQARSAGMFDGAPVGTAVLLGTTFGWRDNAMLLDAVHAARRDGGRLVLLHCGAGGSSLLRVAANEHPGLDTLTVELPPSPSARTVRIAVSLANSGGMGGDLRVGVDGRITRQRREAVELPAAAAVPGVGAGPRAVLVTGGLGGLGIRAAAVLAAAYGWHPVLLDACPPAELPRDASEHLRRLRHGPAGVTVLTADLTDPGELATALASVRTPPMTAVLHCAGLLQGRPLDAFDSYDLALAQRVKVDGLTNVLAALDRRRLRHLVTFGSITAEAPHRSMGSYALANELLTRATLRAAHDLPGCATVAAQWSLWSGAGMAHRAGAVDQARRMGMTPLSLRAGMSTLLRLLAWPPGPEHAAALILDGVDPPQELARRR